jgi:hypothetical protein
LLLAALPRHEEPHYVKVLLSEERKDAVFMVEQREVVDRKEIGMLSSMADILPNIWFEEKQQRKYSEMPEFC